MVVTQTEFEMVLAALLGIISILSVFIVLALQKNDHSIERIHTMETKLSYLDPLFEKIKELGLKEALKIYDETRREGK